MNAKISVFVICVEAIMYFLFHNLHDLQVKQDILNQWKSMGFPKLLLKEHVFLKHVLFLFYNALFSLMITFLVEYC